MLEALHIQGFKCFDSVEISLRRMTLFSGPNSSGKSSAIQAFLLLCNNAVKNSSSPLNGMWLRLGTFDECRNHRTNARTFRVAAVSGKEIFQACLNIRFRRFPPFDSLSQPILPATELTVSRLTSHRVPHPRRVLVFAARAGYRKSTSRPQRPSSSICPSVPQQGPPVRQESQPCRRLSRFSQQPTWRTCAR